MRSIFAIALKDIRLLLRDRMAAFFVLGFPLLMGLFFGSIMMPRSPSNKVKMKVAVVDLDNSRYSQLVVQTLADNENLMVETDSKDAARASVRTGSRIAMLVIPKGFGETAGIFWKKQPPLQLGVDPSRSAEGSMLEGFIMEAVGKLVGKRMTNPTDMLAESRSMIQQLSVETDLSQNLKTNLLELYASVETFAESMQSSNSEPTNESNSGFQLASIEKIDVTQQQDPSSRGDLIAKIRSGWDISFPQAMLWGILGCVAGFAISLAQERESGTLLRLYVAPISRGQLLSGKALACFLATLGVIVLMTVAGLMLGVRPISFVKLGVVAVSVAFCFVGIMLVLSTLGDSVQSVSGIGWSANMIMAMFGGCMIPIMFMPDFMAGLSVLSPVRWAIQSIEGAIWRDYSWLQLLGSLSVLWAIGSVALIIATYRLSTKSA